jgi:hypothetical protein
MVGRSSAQTQHVEHVEQTRLLRRQETHRAQAALRIGGPARRLVRDLDALASTGEKHRVVADDVAAADGREADRRRIALAGHAFARIDGAVLEIAAERFGDHLTHLERRARRRVDLVAMVCFDDLDVVAGGQRLRGHLQQLEGHVDAHAHVGRHHDGDVPGGVRDLDLLRLAEAGGADDRLHAQFATGGQMGERSLGPREVDQDLRPLQPGAQVCDDRNAAAVAQE